MLGFIISALKIIFLLGFLILIHEGGHFLVAKLCKVKVNEFAIGFGPIILKKQGKETKYVLRLIPLGGFVSMEGEEERSDNEGSFSNASIPKRIAIVLAGAVVNIIFAIIVYFGLMFSNNINISKTINNIVNEDIIGILQANDEIIEVNSKKIRLKSDIDKILANIQEREVNIKIKRNGNIEEKKVKLKEEKIKQTGIYFSQVPISSKNTQIIKVDENSDAAKKGIKENDVITKINGIDVENSLEKITQIIQNSTNDTLELTILRDGKEQNIQIKEDEKTKYYIGIEFKIAENTIKNKLYYSFWNTIDFLKSIFENLKMLFTGNVGIEQMMGPVGISGMVSNTKTVSSYINILALISLSLGITNLLPIPALDGGKLLILIIEAIRRKPLKQETEIKIQMIGFMILIGIAIIVTYNDIIRIF